VRSGRAGSFNADLATGLGSPVGPALIADLVASTIARPLVTSATAVRSSAHYAAIHSRKAHLPNRGSKPHKSSGQPHAVVRSAQVRSPGAARVSVHPIRLSG